LAGRLDTGKQSASVAAVALEAVAERREYSDTAVRTISRSRSEVMAMMSGAGRSRESAEARVMPLASGRPRSSSTRSTGESLAPAPEAIRIPSRAVGATPTSENPSSPDRYVRCEGLRQIIAPKEAVAA